jgi:putative selenium metabolism protein SsnA
MLIKNGILITWEEPNRILKNYAVVVQDGIIREIGPEKELVEKYPAEKQFDANGQYVMPGNICAHTHFYGAYSRGLGIPGAAPKDFVEILQKLWWALDKSLSMEAVRYSALVCIIDAIKHGTTTLIDHHASPNAIEGSLDVIAEAVEQTGIRASLCYEVTDRDGESKAKKGIEENVRFFQRICRGDNARGLLAASFGLHASLTLSDKTLEACRNEAPDGMGFHIHVAEHFSDQDDCVAKSGTRVVDRLMKYGILGPKTIAVHAVHVDAKEINCLAETNTWVTHQPRSNMNNAVGVSSVESMLRAGVKVCVGNDGFSNTMWEEWKTTYLVHKLWNRDPRRMNGADVIHMGVYNNAELANMFFGNHGQIGALIPGAQADIIFVDYHPFTPLAEGNLPWHILFGFNESMVTTTIVAGNVLMRDRKLLSVNEAEVSEQALKLAPEIWQKYQNQFTA